MAIPSSGAISLKMFDDEFNLGYSFKNYRGKGSTPDSGAISFSQLRGATNNTRQPSSGDYDNSNYGVSFTTGGIGGTTNAVWEWAGSNVASTSYTATSVSVGSYTYFRGGGGVVGTSKNSNGDTVTSYKYGIYRTGPG